MDKRTFEVEGIVFDLLPVEGGRFVMGATSEQHGEAWDNEKPAHSVSLDSYYLGETVVTRALWQAVMGGDDEGGDLPVTGKSWQECQAFIDKLNNLTGRTFRLPTESEWEFAARGGNQSKGYKFAGGNNLDEVAWYDRNSGATVHPVRQKQPNELGFHDMSGNVWEWCADWYGDYESSSEVMAARNPKGPARGSQRVVRGAGSTYYAQICRVSCRMPLDPKGNANTGLRLAMDEADTTQQSTTNNNSKPPTGTTNMPKPNPLFTQPKKPTPSGTSTTGKGSTSHYWGTEGTQKPKRKLWVLIAAAAVVIVMVIIGVTGKDKKNEEPSVIPIALNTVAEQEPVADNRLAVEIDNMIKDAQRIYDEYKFTSSYVSNESSFDTIALNARIREMNIGYGKLEEALEKIDKEGTCSEFDGARKTIEDLKKEYVDNVNKVITAEAGNWNEEKRNNPVYNKGIKRSDACLAILRKFKGLNPEQE